MSRIDYMTVDQILLQEIRDSELRLSREKYESTYMITDLKPFINKITQTLSIHLSKHGEQ